MLTNTGFPPPVDGFAGMTEKSILTIFYQSQTVFMLTRIFHFYWSLITRQRLWLRAVAIFFIVGIINGAIGYSVMPSLRDILADVYEDIIGESFTFNIPMALKIFVNNATAALLMIFGGVAFGILPFLAIFLNGFIIGYVIIGLFFSFPPDILKTAYFSFATIVPHGIFEIPAILLSTTLGIRFGTEWMKKNAHPSRGDIFRKNFLSALSYIPLLVVILLIAAFIEVFISARIGSTLISDGGFYIQQ